MDYADFILRHKIASIKKSSWAGEVCLLEAPVKSRASFEADIRSLSFSKIIEEELLANVEELNRSHKDVIICCGEAAKSVISVSVIDIPESKLDGLKAVYRGNPGPSGLFSSALSGYLPKSVRVGLISIGKHIVSGILGEESFLTMERNIGFAYSASELSKTDTNRLKNIFNESIGYLFLKGDESIEGVYVGIEEKMRGRLGLLEQNEIFNDKKKDIITMDLNDDAPLEVLIKNSSQFSNFPNVSLVREICIIDCIMTEMHSETGKIVLGFEKIVDALKTGALEVIVVHEDNKSQKLQIENVSTGEQEWAFVDENKVSHVRTNPKLTILQSLDIMPVLNQLVGDYKTNLKIVRRITQTSIEFLRTCQGLAGIKRY